MAPARIAVIGAGLIGSRHVRLAAEEPDCDLVAIADPAPDVEAMATEAGVPLYRDYVEMLRRERPDGAIVAVPNSLHTEVGQVCVACGVHVLIEKPLADTVASGRALLRAADDAGIRVAVGHHRRFDPAVELARETLRAGRIGRLLAVQCLWSVRKHDVYFEAAWRRRRPGGGPVLINLIHDVDLLRHLCGGIVRVQAESGAEARGQEVEDTVGAVLRFESGVLGTITASDAAPSPWGWEQATGENPDVPRTGRNCYRFLGTRGALGFPRLELWRHDDLEGGSWLEPVALEPLETGERASLARQLAHFCRVVRGEEAPRVSGADGLATLAATTAILTAVRTEGPITPEVV